MAQPTVWRMLGIGFLGIGITASAGRAGDLPPLVAPDEAPAPMAPALLIPPTSQTQVKPPADPDADKRPVLALPGLNTPGSRSPRQARPLPPPSSLTPDQADALPPLISPLDRGATTTRPEPITPQTLPSQRFRPRIVESMPRGSTEPPAAKPTTSVAPSPTTRRPPLDSASVRDLPGPRAYDDATNNRSRMLNLFAPQRGPRPDSESSIKTEPRSDPAADAALKRRIEKQAEQTVGNKAKEIDVRVVGRMVTIQARGVRLLQKRNVRKSLEGLPGLSGYKAVIDVRD